MVTAFLRWLRDTPEPPKPQPAVPVRASYQIRADDGSVLYWGDNAGDARLCWERATQFLGPHEFTFYHDGVIRARGGKA